MRARFSRDMAGVVTRTDAAIEACIEAAGHAAFAGEKGVADSGQRQRRRLDHHRCTRRYVSNPGSTPNFGSAIASTLNKSPMPFGPVSVSRAIAPSISAVLFGRRLRLQRRARFSMPRRSRKSRCESGP